MIKVYFSNYGKKLSNSDFYSYLHLLPPEMENRIARFKKWEDRQASLYGKLLLMKVLQESGLYADLLHLKYTNYGRPYLDGIPDFNISHSGFFVVCALSLQGKIGVDIEEIKPVSMDDFKEQFSEKEWELIANSHYRFYYYWTAKEAIIKADGRGLNLPLKEIDVTGNITLAGEKTWFIKCLMVDDSYMLQIATDKAITTEIELKEISF